MFDVVQIAVLERCEGFPFVQNQIPREETDRILTECVRGETELLCIPGVLMDSEYSGSCHITNLFSSL